MFVSQKNLILLVNPIFIKEFISYFVKKKFCLKKDYVIKKDSKLEDKFGIDLKILIIIDFNNIV